eukprot:COSAG01_NODE_31202_length_601_cov_18.450199_1_plen_58_part_10
MYLWCQAFSHCVYVCLQIASVWTQWNVAVLDMKHKRSLLRRVLLKMQVWAKTLRCSSE